MFICAYNLDVLSYLKYIMLEDFNFFYGFFYRKRKGKVVVEKLFLINVMFIFP